MLWYTIPVEVGRGPTGGTGPVFPGSRGFCRTETRRVTGSRVLGSDITEVPVSLIFTVFVGTSSTVSGVRSTATLVYGPQHK